MTELQKRINIARNYGGKKSIPKKIVAPTSRDEKYGKMSFFEIKALEQMASKWLVDHKEDKKTTRWQTAKSRYDRIVHYLNLATPQM